MSVMNGNILNPNNNNINNNKNANAPYTRFSSNAFSSSSSSSTMDLVSGGEVGEIGTRKTTTPTVSIHIDRRRGQQIVDGSRVSRILAFCGAFWRGNIQLRLPLFVLAVVLGSLLPFVLFSLLRSDHQGQNPSQNTLFLEDEFEELVGLKELVSEATKTAQQYATEQSKMIQEAHEIMGITFFLNECLLEMEANGTWNRDNGGEIIYIVNRGEVVRARWSQPKDHNNSSLTTTTTTPDPIKQKAEEEAARERQTKSRALCRKVLDWLRANPWHSVEVLRTHHAEFQRYAEQISNLKKKIHRKE